MRRVACAVLLLGLLSAGCSAANDGLSPGFDEAGERACDQFALYAKDGSPPDSRVAVIEEVVSSASASKVQLVHDNAVVLTRALESGRPETWTLASDVFAKSCLDEGWDG